MSTSLSESQDTTNKKRGKRSVICFLLFFLETANTVIMPESVPNDSTQQVSTSPMASIFSTNSVPENLHGFQSIV